MTEPTIRSVHLFYGNRLVVNLTTTAEAPEESYEVDGVWYDVEGYRPPHIEADGSTGWDVQVHPRE